MKIRQLSFRLENLALARPYSIAYKTVTDVENLFARIELANGIVGTGTCNPSKMVVGENVQDSFRLMQERPPLWLEGCSIGEFHTLLDRVEQEYPNNPGIRAALDIALHDALGQYLGVPVVRFLGQKHSALPTSITVGIKGVDETLEEAEEYVGRGFSYLKIKLGRSAEEDLERLVRLRETFGERIHIRVDANQGYDAQTLKQFLIQTSHLQIELIEQPIPVADTHALSSFPEHQKALFAIDEALITPDDAFYFAQTPRPAGIFNIKLMKCGGIRAGMQIADIAARNQIQLMWGCNDESRVSIAAGLHAAFASANTRYLDLDGSLDLARDLAEGGFVIENGVMRLTGRAGLGCIPV